MVRGLMVLLLLIPAVALANPECESRLSATTQSLVKVVLAGLEKKVLTFDEVKNFARRRQFLNLFESASYTHVLNGQFRRAFAQLAGQVSPAETREFFDALEAKLNVIDGQAVESAGAKLATRTVLAPKPIWAESNGDYSEFRTRELRTEGWMEGRPIFVRHMRHLKDTADFVEMVFDPLNPNPARRQWRIPSGELGWSFHKGLIVNVGGTDYLLYLREGLAWELTSGKAVHELLRSKEFISQLPFPETVNRIDGKRYGVTVDASQNLHVVDLDSGGPARILSTINLPFSWTNGGATDAMVFKYGDRLMAAVGIMGLRVLNRVALIDVKKQAIVGYLNGFDNTLTTDFVRIQMANVQGEQKFFTRGEGRGGGNQYQYKILFMNASGDVDRVPIDFASTHPTPLRFEGVDYLIWAYTGKIGLLNLSTLKVENFPLKLEKPLYLEAFEHEGKIKAFVSTVKGAELLEITPSSN